MPKKKAVRNQHRLQARADGLSSTVVKELYGRHYQVGESWNVASWILTPTTMRKTGETNKLSPQVGNGGIFHYEVVRSEPGSSQPVTLKITQVKYKDFRPVDSRFESLTLSADNLLTQSRKDYFLRGRTQGLSVSPEGVHSGMTPLELYPLDIPDISSAEKTKPKALPQLPPKVQDTANKLGFKADLARSQWFEQDDFFGRPIQVLWQQGDPWPAYIKTPGGISILIHEEGL